MKALCVFLFFFGGGALTPRSPASRPERLGQRSQRRGSRMSANAMILSAQIGEPCSQTSSLFVFLPCGVCCDLGDDSVFCRSGEEREKKKNITQSKSESSGTHAQFATYAARILRGGGKRRPEIAAPASEPTHFSMSDSRLGVACCACPNRRLPCYIND